MHPGVERTGSHERVRGDEIVEPVAAHAPEHVGRERRLELEHARCPTGPQHLVDLGVVEGNGVDVEVTIGACLDRLHRVMYDGERREAEEVHLEHPRLFERVHVVLTDDDGLVVSAGA